MKPKGGMTETEEAVIAMQQFAKQALAATNMHATI
jgi:hypothetical protein